MLRSKSISFCTNPQSEAKGAQRNYHLLHMCYTYGTEGDNSS